MSNTRTWLQLAALIAVPLAHGCAPAYHHYSDCFIPCQYCPPPALPYSLYEDCACHSCAASPYLIPAQPPTIGEDRAEEPAVSPPDG